MNILKSAFNQIEKQIEQLDEEYKLKRQRLEIQRRRLTLEYEIDSLIQQEKDLANQDATYMLNEVQNERD